ncbi:hypothetical protein P168DRAFT_68433 [Aspergillus campestris IBT 28561]|uniref:Uncharacterized protein n=1 Tax=Aspergillus campestris (strain IBT 28561) TaxID=1392248 RepID=A0A2I1CS64_ASPC2|nr:uncharacterized protein P168DRAFT_68433 [Aspergillus campestris IBT 28561]PKY00470.1 hypothetical protein P168DRAFT_68433 [Aspergillus campestris IBT 28561]
MEISTDQIPDGWSNDPQHLQVYFRPNSQEMEFARDHGLDNVSLLLFNTPDTGSLGFIITSGGRYYWGDLMIDHLFEITQPKTFPAILRRLAQGGMTALRMKRMKQIPLEGENKDV